MEQKRSNRIRGLCIGLIKWSKFREEYNKQKPGSSPSLKMRLTNNDVHQNLLDGQKAHRMELEFTSKAFHNITLDYECCNALTCTNTEYLFWTAPWQILSFATQLSWCVLLCKIIFIYKAL